MAVKVNVVGGSPYYVPDGTDLPSSVEYYQAYENAINTYKEFFSNNPASKFDVLDFINSLSSSYGAALFEGVGPALQEPIDTTEYVAGVDGAADSGDTTGISSAMAGPSRPGDAVRAYAGLTSFNNALGILGVLSAPSVSTTTSAVKGTLAAGKTVKGVNKYTDLTDLADMVDNAMDAEVEVDTVNAYNELQANMGNMPGTSELAARGVFGAFLGSPFGIGTAVTGYLANKAIQDAVDKLEADLREQHKTTPNLFGIAEDEGFTGGIVGSMVGPYSAVGNDLFGSSSAGYGWASEFADPSDVAEIGYEGEFDTGQSYNESGENPDGWGGFEGDIGTGDVEGYV